MAVLFDCGAKLPSRSGARSCCLIQLRCQNLERKKIWSVGIQVCHLCSCSAAMWVLTTVGSQDLDFSICFSKMLFPSTSWDVRFVDTEMERMLPAYSPGSISYKSSGIQSLLFDSFHLSSTSEVWNGVSMRISKFLSKCSNPSSWKCKCHMD